MKPVSPSSVPRAAFTLVELLVVISIIIILAGLLFPAFGAVQLRTKKIQASTDELAIVNAVNNYYTEYRRYPVAATVTTDVIYGKAGTADYNNAQLLNVLRGLPTTEDGTNSGSDFKLNARQTVFLEAKNAKDATDPKNGISTNDATKGQWMDPWGKPYVVFVDADYNNHISPTIFKRIYTACTDTEDASGNIVAGVNATSPTPQVGVAVSSFGKDLAPGTKTSGAGDSPMGDGNYTKSICDDVVSWR